MYKLLACIYTLLCIFHRGYAQEADNVLRPFILQSATTGIFSKQQENAQKSFPAYVLKTDAPLPEGVVIRRKLSANIFIVSVYNASAKKILQDNSAVFVPANDLWKLSPALLSNIPDERSTKWMSLLVGVSSVSLFEKQHPSVSIKTVESSVHALALQVAGAWISNALSDTNIIFIAEARKPFIERELTGFDLSANRVNKVHRVWPAINGNGLTVSIKENRMDTLDIDLKGRYLYSSSASGSVQTHATTMATIVVGGGNTFYTGKGVAWNASVSSSDFANLLPDKLQELQRLKVSVQNHSYGVGIENYYGADAAAYDAQTLQDPVLLHVFSAGNIGTQSSTSGNYTGIQGFANLSGSFKMAKNIITVGAADSFGTTAPLSSRGPAYDGRLKPELTALGEDGSSGAAAIVSGIALLVQNAWQKMYNVLPASAVTKSILLNSADDTGPVGIDFISGFGCVNAWRALRTIYDGHVVQGTVSHSQTVSHNIVVPANATALKITLSWTDPPAQANSYKALVNDLDAELFHPSTSQRWLPWVLNSASSIDSLQKMPVRKKDSINNNEQITIDNPIPGMYELQVKGFAITGTAQSYAVAWQFDTLSNIEFIYPVKGNNIVPAQNNTIRWEGGTGSTGALQYRLNSGSWQNIASGIDLSKRFYQWQAPDTIAALQLRMITGAKEAYTDTVSLSRLLLINTGFNCTDSFLVYWQRAAVDSYRVYRLGQQYLEPFATMSDTALIQYKQNNPYTYFTVAPILPFQTEGLRSYTFDYTQQQVACYISGFIADPSGAASARLTLQLGTTFRVSRIVFEKLSATGFQVIREITPITTKQIIADVAAGKGLNTYRARVILQDGTSYYTQPENVLIFGQPYYVFPNPVRPGAPLQFMSEDTDETEFVLYDLLGRKLASQKINGFINRIRLPLLQRGVYFYTVLKSGTKQLSGQLVVD
ncbi:MAG: S8 family peptidase [Bacteroidota bacterium]